MKLSKIAFWLFISFFKLDIAAQIGIQVSGMNHLLNPNTTSKHLQAEALKAGDLGISYGLRLKTVRIEMHPVLSLAYGTGDFLDSDLAFSEMGAAFNLPILFYLLDFADDCNCPTFNKQGEVFEKGLYILIQPGINHVWTSLKNLDEAPDYKGFLPEIGLGLGFDFGLSRQTTLSAFVVLSRTFNGHYEFDELLKTWEKSAAHMNLQLGFRYLWYSKRIR
ncbi:MAG: hypothetical protein IPM92_06350 [Saprospiraceae bacterium]|nr:hypothetical protein [Saprospiraceae bacterium]